MTINILAVDDKEINLYSLESLLKELKIEDENDKLDDINVIKALSGEEALKIAIAKDIDLVILDIQMPGMNGFEVAKFLKSNHKTKNIPIIFLTAAFKAEEFVKQGFEVGAIDYFTKPIEKYQFLNRIKLYATLFIKTKKLENLNQNLEDKIKKEVDANREKDKMLFEQSKMAQMGDMIGNIAHQWRQPLSVISSAASGIKLNAEFDMLKVEDIPESMDAIVRSTKYLSQTIDTFRDFIKEKKELKEVIVQERIDYTLKILSASLENNYIKLIKNINYNDPIKVDIIVGELSQVLINIINNAKDILKEKQKDNSWIKLELKKEKSKAILTIEDNGGGIPKDILPKIFDPYFTTKHESQGTGLGLYMSYNIICKSLKGKLYAKNTQDGAKFFIELPLKS